MIKKDEILDKNFKAFTQEAELFFITKFMSSPKLKEMYSFGLDVIFNLTGEQDSNRGLIAFNTRYGQGKSFFFDVINHRCRRIEGKNKFVRTSAKELVEIYKGAPNGQDPVRALDDFIKVKNLFIDDIGDEGTIKTFSHYANKLNVLRHVLLKRYEYWVEKGWKTYGTTNLTIQQIAVEYDGRVSDRLLQMCYWKEFQFLDEGSFRQIESTRMLTQEEREANYEKLAPKEEEPKKVDVKEYLEELINDQEYIEQKKGDYHYWSWVYGVLVELSIINKRPLTDSELVEAKVIILKKLKDAKNSGESILAIKKMTNNLEVTESDIKTTALGRRGFQEFKKLITKNYKFV